MYDDEHRERREDRSRATLHAPISLSLSPSSAPLRRRDVARSVATIAWPNAGAELLSLLFSALSLPLPLCSPSPLLAVAPCNIPQSSKLASLAASNEPLTFTTRLPRLTSVRVRRRARHLAVGRLAEMGWDVGWEREAGAPLAVVLVRSLGYLPACRDPPDANSAAGAEGEIVGPLAKSPKITSGAE